MQRSFPNFWSLVETDWAQDEGFATKVKSLQKQALLKKKEICS
jgi:hypothetical protein